MDTEDILVYRKRDYQIDVLVSDIEKARRKYPKIIIDHTTIDEIMLLLVKGKIDERTFEKQFYRGN